MSSIGIIRSFASPATEPGAITYGDGVLWHIDQARQRILLLDPLTGAILKSLKFLGLASGLCFWERKLWIADQSLQLAYLYDPYQNEIIRHLKLSPSIHAVSLSCSREHLWQLNDKEERIYGFDLKGGQLEQVIELDAYLTTALWFNGQILICELGKSTLRQRNLPTMTAGCDYALPSAAASVTWGADNFWYLDKEYKQICQFRLN